MNAKSQMRRKFNITGSCNPVRHYMVDSKKRFKAVEDYMTQDMI